MRTRMVSRHWGLLLSALLFSTCTVLWSDAMVQLFLLCSLPLPRAAAVPSLGHMHPGILEISASRLPSQETLVQSRTPCWPLPYSAVCTVFLAPRTAYNCLSNLSSYLFKKHLWVPQSGTPGQSLSTHLTTTYN